MTPLPRKRRNITTKVSNSPPSTGSSHNKLKRKSGSISSAPPPPKPNKKRKLKQQEVAAETTMATQAAQDDLEIDFPAIRAWLAKQENNPTIPLTSSQRRALADLTRCIKVEEPPLGDKDYISLLGRYRDAHRNLEGPSHVFKEDEAPNEPGKWICICTFQGHRDSLRRYTFPSPQSANSATDEVVIPAFARKKDAKKYAAKCCVEWLMRERYMPSDGSNVVFPHGAVGVKYFTPDSAQEPAGMTENQNAMGAGAGAGATANAPPPAPARIQELVAAQIADSGGVRLDEGGATSANRGNNVNGNASKKAGASEIDVHDEDVPITKRVEAMCRRLGLVMPRYVTTANPRDGNYFDGYADFGADACRIPDEVGRSEFVYSKSFTKLAIAEKVLKRLLLIEAERSEGFETLIEAERSEGVATLIDDVLRPDSP